MPKSAPPNMKIFWLTNLRYFSLYFPVSPDEKIFTTRDEKANPVISFSGSTWEPFIQVLPKEYFKAEP